RNTALDDGGFHLPEAGQTGRWHYKGSRFHPHLDPEKPPPGFSDEVLLFPELRHKRGSESSFSVPCGPGPPESWSSSQKKAPESPAPDLPHFQELWPISKPEKPP